jgi:hypothetical protein
MCHIYLNPSAKHCDWYALVSRYTALKSSYNIHTVNIHGLNYIYSYYNKLTSLSSAFPTSLLISFHALQLNQECILKQRKTAGGKKTCARNKHKFYQCLTW